MSERGGTTGLTLAMAAALAVALAIVATVQATPAGLSPPPFASSLPPETRARLSAEYTHAFRDSIRFPSPPMLVAMEARRKAEIKGEIALDDPVIAAFGVNVARRRIAGVPALEIVPPGAVDDKRVLVHLHGGAYVFGSAAQTLDLSVPLAAASGLRTLSVDYTSAPSGDWRQATAEVVAVMQGLLAEGYKPADIAFFGDSAGGGLAAGAILRMRESGVALPGALLLWSPWTDLTRRGDSTITLAAADPLLSYDRLLAAAAAAYAAPKDQHNPWVSPVYGDFKPGFPPTLVQAGTREILLSDAVRLVSALDDAGVPTRLDLAEGMPHVFQRHWQLPEARRAIDSSARFLKRHLTEPTQ